MTLNHAEQADFDVIETEDSAAPDLQADALEAPVKPRLPAYVMQF